MSKTNEWIKMGQLKQAKSGRFYISVENDVNLPKGTAIQLRSPKEELESLVKNGVLTEEKAAERLEKIPDFVKYNLVIPPASKRTSEDIL